MANEINLQINAQLNNAGLVDAVNHSKQITQSVKGKFDQVFSVTTTEGALTLTITTLGWAFITNLDTTNFVTYGPEDTSAMIPWGKLMPGETHAMRLVPGITVRMDADTNTCLVRVQIWNN